MAFLHKVAQALRVLCLLGILGTFVHSIVAMASTPPLWPASWIIDLQALWEDGTYELKLSWALTLFYELVPFGSAIALYLGMARLFDALRSPRPKAATVGWEPLLRRSRPRSAAWGASLILTSGLFLLLVVTAPELLSPGGMLAVFPLMAAPFMSVGGLVLLLDGVVPPEVHVGSVESREVIADKSSNAPRYRVTLGGKVLYVSVKVYDQMGDGSQYWAESAAVSGRMLALARKQMGYRE